MLKTSIGIDFVEFGEFHGVERKPRFLKRIFTPGEIKYCRGKTNPLPFFAARYAAKEAVIKALGSLGKKSFYSEIEILKRDGSAPKVKLKKGSGFQVMISFSHGRNHAVAVAFAKKVK